MTKQLHVVAFDVPFPANYGGVIDVFYKLKALHKLGVSVTLHAFQYGREKAAELESICDKVNYYPRCEKWKNHFNGLPYIVKSRSAQSLLNNLLKDDAPILFEGLHSTSFLAHPLLQKRQKLVRTHNIEHDYYQGLASVERNWFRKLFFKLEAFKLKRYEHVLSEAQCVFAISDNDLNHLKQYKTDVSYLPAFHPNETVTSQLGKGNYALYHGNLAVGENKEGVRFLVERVFANESFKLVVAGGGADKELKQLIAKHPNASLDENSDMEHIKTLVKEARVNVLPTFQPTGIKLKLLFALFNGRFCLVNSHMVDNTGLEDVCVIANKPAEFKKALRTMEEQTFAENDLNIRCEKLQNFSNSASAEILIKGIWNH